MEIKYSITKTITDDVRKLTIPLVEASQDLAAKIRRRVSNRGETADGGRFTPLKRPKDNRTIRRFYKSGRLWESLFVNASQPGRIRIAFKGKREKGKGTLTNAQLAWLLQRNETSPILAPNKTERLEFMRNIEVLAQGQWLRSIPAIQGNWKRQQQDLRNQRMKAKAARLIAQLKLSGVPTNGR